MPGSNQHEKESNLTDEPVDTSRRDALKKMGKYSAYTAPALLALLTPKQGKAGPMSMIIPG